jgi:formylglycine-generating enzyme required for sulfatase activity
MGAIAFGCERVRALLLASGSMSRDPRIARLQALGPVATPFVDLDGGTFVMGSDLRSDEGPAHEVTVGPFAVALVPVSNPEFRAFMDATGHPALPFLEDDRFNAPDQPVVGVNWDDANAYCAWLSELLERPCRLPTEAEREFAARGGLEGALFPWGDEPWTDGPYALGAAGTDRPVPIGSMPPNGFGLFHMGENVHEWCSDWYSRAGYAGLASADPRGVEEGERRASRGGSWRHRVKVSRIAARSSLAPDRRYNDYGMRVYASI